MVVKGKKPENIAWDEYDGKVFTGKLRKTRNNYVKIRLVRQTKQWKIRITSVGKSKVKIKRIMSNNVMMLIQL